MAEYIAREVLLAQLRAMESYNVSPMYRRGYDDCVEAILKAPAADVVPVVRWIPVTERLPEPETEVMIVCNDNGRRFIATAIHENGKQLSEESCWVWTDIWEYGRYDEEHDDYFVPEGWWESRCFTPDDVYNCPVDCEVTHWMPMPELPKMDGGVDNG